MRKLLIFGLCFTLVIGFIGCSRQRNSTENPTNGIGNLTKWAEIYQVTLDSYLKQDTALNENIDFIAIDLSTLEFTNEDDKKLIVTWFESNHVPVKDSNLDGLRAEGLFDEERLFIPDGVLLEINKVTEKNNEIIIEGMKYRGGLGANGFETKWRLNNGIWEFVETIMTWIS